MARDSGRSRGDSGRGSSRGGYEYKPRSAEETKKRGDEGGSQFDSYINDSITLYTAPVADNIIRIMPPTFEDPKHWGMDLHVHYNIGADREAYLCLKENFGKPCPICEERAKAQRDGDEDYAAKLKPSRRVAVYLVDRDAEKDGVQMWVMPWTFDRDLIKLAVDKRSGELMPIDHPDEGYDIEFERKGAALKTEYLGIQISRRSSDLGDRYDEFMDFVIKNPIDQQLIEFPYEHIKAKFNGGSTEDEKPASTARRGRGEPEAPAEAPSRRRDARGKQLPTWDDVHGMSFDEMAELIEAQGLDIDPEESKDDDDLADWICEVMKIEKDDHPAPEPEPEVSSRRRRPAAPAEDSTESKVDAIRNRPRR